MTATTNTPATAGASGPGQVPAGYVTVTVDGVTTSVPKGTLIIRVAESLGVDIPRFCDHPLLEPVAACRACLVEIEGQGKPQPSCAVTVTDGMVVKTQHTSVMADEAQKGVMEFLLINHPLDCPVCDKGGECPLQNQAMSVGRAESRFTIPKRTFPKPINVSAQVLLDRERCVSCARCTRFSDQIAGDPFISLLERGAKQQVGTSSDTPFNSYFSGNTIQICPVGALTSAKYRFRSRPFDLISVPTVCEHCASGCGLRADVRRGSVMRRLAWDTPEVNEEWNCDKGRFAFPYLEASTLTHPRILDGDKQVTASWPEALSVAANGLREAGAKAAVLIGGRLTREDAYAYGKFARTALGTNSIDFRARAASAEEAGFLAAHVAGTGLGVTYADLEAAPTVLLVGIEPEEESPIVFLRLRKAARTGRTKVFAVAPWVSPGIAKARGRVLATAPGLEAIALDALAAGGHEGLLGDAEKSLREAGSVILVGERAATAPGALTSAVALAAATGAKLAWIPRRAGERGALDAGALPNLLPGGRPVADESARAELAAAWGADLPAEPGLDFAGVVEAVLADAAAVEDSHVAQAEGSSTETVERTIKALVVAGVDSADLPDPAGFLAALEAAPFVVAIETADTEVTKRADVVLPVGALTGRTGTFVNWEGRERPFGQVIHGAHPMTDARILAAIADELDVTLAADPKVLGAELSGLGAHKGTRVQPEAVAAPATPQVAAGEAVLASWRHLLDEGLSQQGEPYLAGTRRPSVARISAGTAAGLDLLDGENLLVHAPGGSIELPAVVTDMPDSVVWVPAHSIGSDIGSIGAKAGDVVRIEKGEQA